MIHSCPRATYTQKTQRYIKDNKYYKYRDSKALIIEVDIGTFPPNAFSLYDMHGNVWEWCENDQHNNYTNALIDSIAWNSRSCKSNKMYSGNDNRMATGGSWYADARLCRSALRHSPWREIRGDRFGFRVVSSFRTL